MQYSERYSDRECQQTYQELVHSSMSHYAGGEALVIAELLSQGHVKETTSRAARPSFSWLYSLLLDRLYFRFLTPQA